MLVKFLEPDFVLENENGCLKQLVHNGWKQVNVIISRAGSIRGGHYHRYNQEGFYVIEGGFLLKVWKGREYEFYDIKPGDMFLIMPYAFHTFEYHKKTILVSMYEKGVELSDGRKDIWTE